MGIVPFHEYKIWAWSKNDINYVVPTESFSKSLEQKSAYDNEGNFLLGSLDIKDYFNPLQADLQELLLQNITLAKKWGKKLKLLTLVSRNSSW